MLCPNSIPAEISRATPRSNTGQQSKEDFKKWFGGLFIGVAVIVAIYNETSASFLVRKTCL